MQLVSKVRRVEGIDCGGTGRQGTGILPCLAEESVADVGVEYYLDGRPAGCMPCVRVALCESWLFCFELSEVMDV